MAQESTNLSLLLHKLHEELEFLIKNQPKVDLAPEAAGDRFNILLEKAQEAYPEDPSIKEFKPIEGDVSKGDCLILVDQLLTIVTEARNRA